MTRLYLAWNQSGSKTTENRAKFYPDKPISLLVSMHYLHQWYKDRHLNTMPVTIMLDSGAYSAYNSGVPVDMDALIEESKKPEYFESAALDDIESWQKSKENAIYMKSQGSPAYPVFHIGEPWELLDFYCSEFKKVGLSCRFGESLTASMAWYGQCFARNWPHKFHSFGCVAERILMEFPFHSADAASWILGPLVYGRWKGMKGVHREGKRITYKDLNLEVDAFEELEQRTLLKWDQTLKETFGLQYRDEKPILVGE